MRLLLTFVFLSSVAPAYAQFTTQLQPQTVNEFDRYARKAEQQLAARWHGEREFLSTDDDSSMRAKIVAGDLLIVPGTPDNPVGISNGLIHDWVGTVFIPNTSMAKVLAILQDFDRHSRIYPNIIRSRLIRHDGNDVVGFWRLERKDPVLPVVLDVEQQAHYDEVRPGKWTCKAYAKNISEVENSGTLREKKLPPGEGRGFLWRLYAYWSLQTTNGGVIGECRTLSLSRSVPLSVAWAIRPFVQSLPRESLAATLRNTRSAAAK